MYYTQNEVNIIQIQKNTNNGVTDNPISLNFIFRFDFVCVT